MIDYDGSVSKSTALATVRVLNVQTGTWEVIDGPRSGSTSDTAATWSTTNPAWYVGADGRVTTSALATNSSKFQLRTDFVRFTISY